MFYQALSIAVALIVIAGIVCIALARSPAVPSVKRTLEAMNAEEAHRAELRAKDAQLSQYRFALLQIAHAFEGQVMNGQARKAVNLAKQGLEG